jgi:hypothetical protein
VNSLRDTIRQVLEEGTTANFGAGPVGFLTESQINRLTTELTDAVLDTAMFQALTGNQCEWVRVPDDDRADRLVRFPNPHCDIHARELA